MTTPTLADADARLRALTEREHSLIVEAGAGSGKTALMAGRVVLLLADGVRPDTIAAITFTELAAAELADRIRRMAEDLLDDQVPIELKVALPKGLSAERKRNLRAGALRLDDLTASTIHGFAYDLIRPYPAEADMDPGARPMDPDEAALLMDDVFDGWLRARLSGPARGDDVVAQLALQGRNGFVADLRELARLVLDHPDLTVSEMDGAAFLRILDDAERALRRLESTVDAFHEVPEGGAEMLAGFRRVVSEPRRRGGGAVSAAFGVLDDRPAPPFKVDGGLRQKGIAKTKWKAAAKACGRSAADGERAHDACQEAYEAFCAVFSALEAAAVDLLLAASIDAVREVRERYTLRKREGALLDFDDLLSLAVCLLKDHDEVRTALADRYHHVLVDEFQDTDPRQAEIIWRLTGEPRGDDWRAWPARGPRRFVVGDPKQSIYRFRLADVTTYLELRDRMRNDPYGDELSITTNFRSLPGILEATNRTFEAVLAADGQPGYRPLSAHRGEAERPGVARLEVPLPEGADATKGPSVAAAREKEAQAVARLCARLVDGDPTLTDAPVRPGRIALLAPAGTELWRYERELERMNLSVATQAGKGFYRRQEVQDLVALARCLADPFDVLAFGALLRGPLVGATDERLLDAVEELRAAEEDPDDADRARLTVRTDPEVVSDPAIRRVLERLGPLSRRARARTPYRSLAAAIEQLEVRAIVRHRHGGRADRALANVERFLESSRPWAVRGIRAFARDVFERWKDEERTIEGRPDADTDAITLITVHSAKGLEWDVVVPINTLGKPQDVRGAFVARADGRLWNRFAGFSPSGWDDALDDEKKERHAENVRLLYVAATRARDLLVVPKPGWDVHPDCWLGITALCELDAPTISFQDVHRPPSDPPRDAAQDRDAFSAEAARIAEATPRIHWSAPSRHDGPDETVPASAAAATEPVVDEAVVPGVVDTREPEEDADNGISDVRSSTDAPTPSDEPPAVAGRGWVRGLVLHALMEQLVTGEIDEPELEDAAATLTDALLGIRERSESEVDTGRPDPAEMARAARTAWSASDLADVRDDLLAEVNVYERVLTGGVENLTAGIVDALAVDADGRPYEVLDWKSDVDPSDDTIARYRQQVMDYIRLAGVDRGRIVFLTSGEVVEVTPAAT